MYVFKIFGTILMPTIVLTSLAPTHLLVTRAGPCYEEQDTIIKITELSIATKSYDSSLSGIFNISQDIQSGWRVKATMQKCQDIRNTDTCDYFKSFNFVKNGCGDPDDGNLYSMLFRYTKPRLSCPLRAGSYKVTHYPVFTEDNYLTVYESKISTSVFGYTFRLEGYVGEEQKMFCVEAYLQLLYMREHSWISGRKNVRNTTVKQISKEADSNGSDE